MQVSNEKKGFIVGVLRKGNAWMNCPKYISQVLDAGTLYSSQYSRHASKVIKFCTFSAFVLTPEGPNFKLSMKLILRIFSILWKIYFILVLVVILLGLYPFYYVFLNNEKYFERGFRLMRFQARFMLFLVGIYPKIDNSALKKIDGPFIICPNHTSYLDILLLYRLFPDYFIFMGKQELKDVPIFNIFFKKMNILVDRKSVTGSVRALGEAEQEIDRNRNVVIFPEGTIPHLAPKMKKFKNGPFKLAIKKQVPIVPVTFVNNYLFLQDGAFFKRNGRPGVPKIVVHAAIETKGMTEANLVSLRDQVFNTIQKPLLENEH